MRKALQRAFSSSLFKKKTQNKFAQDIISSKNKKSLESITKLLQPYGTQNSQLFKAGTAYLESTMEREEYYKIIDHHIKTYGSDWEIPDLYITLFNTNSLDSKEFLNESNSRALMDILQKIYCKHDITKLDIFVLNLGLSKYVMNTRNVLNIQEFITLEDDFSELFKKLDSTFLDTLKSLQEFQDWYFMVQNLSKSNIMTQDLYFQFGEYLHWKGLQDIHMFNLVRLFSIFAKSKSFCEDQHNQIRKMLVQTIVPIFKEVKVHYAIKILHIQALFTQPVFEEGREFLDFHRLFMRITQQSLQGLQQLDNVSQKNLHLALKALDKQIDIQKYENLSTFRNSLENKCQSGELIIAEYKNRSDKQKESFRLINQAFRGIYDATIEGEKPFCLYNIDIYLNVPSLNLHNIAIEVSNFKTKNFRNEYENPGDRLRNQILTNHGFKVMSIDTLSFPNYEDLHETEKQDLLKSYIQSQSLNV